MALLVQMLGDAEQANPVSQLEGHWLSEQLPYILNMTLKQLKQRST